MLSSFFYFPTEDDLLEELLRKAEPEGYAEPEGQAAPKGFDEDLEEQGNLSSWL